LISGFRPEVAEICALLKHYAAMLINSYRRFEATYRSQLLGSRNQDVLVLIN